MLFERTLRAAFGEAANQAAMIENLGKRYALKAQQVEILRRAIEVSNQLASARADYMEVLMTRRDALEAQLELIETKRMQLGAVVDMYRALGGGWRRAEPRTRAPRQSRRSRADDPSPPHRSPCPGRTLAGHRTPHPSQRPLPRARPIVAPRPSLHPAP